MAETESVAELQGRNRRRALTVWASALATAVEIANVNAAVDDNISSS